jgi:HEAT repeat protein
MNFSANLCALAYFAFNPSVFNLCFIRGCALLTWRCRSEIAVLSCLFILGCGGSASRLIAELDHEDPQVRRQAARALSDSQYAGDERVVAALVGAVADADVGVSQAAITTLGRFGEAAKPAVPVLEGSLSHSESRLRLAAARSLAKIDPQSTRYQQEFLEALREGNGPVFLEVGRMGKKAQWAVPTLVELLNHQQTHVRALAAQTLGEIGIASDEITSALQRRLQDSEPSVRHAAQSAIKRLDPSM